MSILKKIRILGLTMTVVTLSACETMPQFLSSPNGELDKGSTIAIQDTNESVKDAAFVDSAQVPGVSESGAIAATAQSSGSVALIDISACLPQA